MATFELTVPFIKSFADELEVENEATLDLLYKLIERSIQIMIDRGSSLKN